MHNRMWFSLVERYAWDVEITSSNLVRPTIKGLTNPNGLIVARGVSSAGRAPALQAGGHRFDPDTLHHRGAGLNMPIAGFIPVFKEDLS